MLPEFDSWCSLARAVGMCKHAMEAAKQKSEKRFCSLALLWEGEGSPVHYENPAAHRRPRWPPLEEEVLVHLVEIHHKLDVLPKYLLLHDGHTRPVRAPPPGLAAYIPSGGLELEFLGGVPAAVVIPACQLVSRQFSPWESHAPRVGLTWAPRAATALG